MRRRLVLKGIYLEEGNLSHTRLCSEGLLLTLCSSLRVFLFFLFFCPNHLPFTRGPLLPSLNRGYVSIYLCLILAVICHFLYTSHSPVQVSWFTSILTTFEVHLQMEHFSLSLLFHCLHLGMPWFLCVNYVVCHFTTKFTFLRRLFINVFVQHLAFSKYNFKSSANCAILTSSIWLPLYLFLA